MSEHATFVIVSWEWSAFTNWAMHVVLENAVEHIFNNHYSTEQIRTY